MGGDWYHYLMHKRPYVCNDVVVVLLDILYFGGVCIEFVGIHITSLTVYKVIVYKVI